MCNVYVSLAGGVGNQLFQVAAGFDYSVKYKKNLLLDSERWSASQGNNPEKYRYKLLKNFRYTKVCPEHTTKYFEKRFNHDEIPFYTGNVTLHGYFQSLKYFENHKQDFINKLNLPSVKTDWIEEKNVAVHIRRGDYLQHHNIHLVCKTDYFKREIGKFKDYQINVFTDSLDFVEEEFKDLNINIIDSGDEIKDLTLMSFHDNIICSNSSFSWWASLLSKKKEKIIVPDKWFHNFEDHEDIYRRDFTRVKV